MARSKLEATCSPAALNWLAAKVRVLEADLRDLQKQQLREKVEMLQPDTITYHPAVIACKQGGECDQALRLSGDMALAQPHLDTITCDAAVSACTKNCEWDHALRLVHIAGHDEKVVKPLVGMASALLRLDTITCDSAVRIGEWDQALRFLVDMVSSEFHVDPITYNAAVSVCGACKKGGESDHALRLLGIRASADLDTITYDAAVGAAGQDEKSVAQPSGQDEKVDTITCDVAVSACKQKGICQDEQVARLLVQMESDQVDTITCDAAESACCEVDSDTITCDATVRACKEVGSDIQACSVCMGFLVTLMLVMPSAVTMLLHYYVTMLLALLAMTLLWQALLRAMLRSSAESAAEAPKEKAAEEEFAADAPEEEAAVDEAAADAPKEEVAAEEAAILKVLADLQRSSQCMREGRPVVSGLEAVGGDGVCKSVVSGFEALGETAAHVHLSIVTYNAAVIACEKVGRSIQALRLSVWHCGLWWACVWRLS